MELKDKSWFGRITILGMLCGAIVVGITMAPFIISFDGSLESITMIVLGVMLMSFFVIGGLNLLRIILKEGKACR